MTTPPFSPPAVRPSSSLPDALWLAQADVISVPLQTFSQRPFVQVILNGHPALFLLDTSIHRTSVDADSLTDALRLEPSQSLQIGELRFLHVQAIRNGVRTYAQTYLGATADGVIGADLMARFPIALDYKSGTFSIFRNSQAAAAAWPAQSMVVPLTLSAGVAAVPIAMGGEGGLFGIDTGSGMDFELRASAVAFQHIRVSGTLPELREERFNGSMHGKTARVNGAAIGSLQIAGPLVAMLDKRQSWLPNGVDGMLGGRLLEKMNLVIDVPGQTLAISAQNLASSTYDRSGAWLVSHAGDLFVHDVVPGSPADSAGLSIGDQIVEINKVPVPLANLETVRQTFLQAPGTRVTVTYLRARRRHTTILVLRNLL